MSLEGKPTEPLESTIPLDQLHIGQSSPSDLCDCDGLLLIAAGVPVTPTIIENLKRHGIETLHIRRSSPPAPIKQPIKKPFTRPATAPERKRQTRQPPSADDPTLKQQPLSSSYSPAKVARIERLHAKSLETVQRLVENLNEGQPADISETDPVIDGFLRELTDHPDAVVANAIRFDADLDLAKRCVQFSVLALAVGIRTNQSAASLRELGRAALLHDCGLFELAPEARFPHFRMPGETRRLYRQHPITAEALIQSVRGATFTLGVIVAQVHELLNGSGFPRQLTTQQIHPLARLLSVVDTYLMLTSPPCGHVRILPCDGIAYLLSGVAQGQYAPSAVTGLLETVTLYPIGSVIELSDTTKARVVGSNGSDYGYPVVESLAEAGKLINLKESELFVTRPIPQSQYHEARLPATYTDLRSAVIEA